MSVWTAERTQTLKTMWADGLSASQIAEALQCGVTRNAVIGRIHRLKLTRPEPHYTRRRVRISQGRKRQCVAQRVLRDDTKLKSLRAPEVVRVAMPEPVSLDLTILELRDATETTPGTCKYPHGNKSPYRFCGQPTPTVLGAVYCTEHDARCRPGAYA